MSIASSWDFFESLRRFEEMGLRCFKKKETQKFRHLDIGHNKPDHLRIAKSIAISFPESEIVYYDNSQPDSESDIDSENISGILGSLKEWLIRMFGSENLRIGKNLKLTRSPKAGFDSATYVWTLHEFENPAESLKGTYNLLLPDGRIGIMEYILGWINELPAEKRDGMFRRIFRATQNEREILKQEGIEACYKMHTQFTDKTLVSLLESCGYKAIDSESSEIEYTKVHGAMRPKYLRWFGEKIG